MTTDPGDLVLDPTCGSGTTAYVAEQWGRRWITIDTSRVALALARTRLMAAKYPYFLLADSPEGIEKEAEITGKSPDLLRDRGRYQKGFVYKRVPHVTLKSIANNEEIDAIHASWQEKLEPLRRTEQSSKQKWQEWEIPREPKTHGRRSRKAPEEWWKLRRERQQEIDAVHRPARRNRTALRPALRRHQAGPCERSLHGRKPFAPSRAWPPRRGAAAESEAAGREAKLGLGQFETMILENLRKAGCRTP